MQPEEFRTVFRGSPVRRAKLSGLRRNAVIAMGNSGDEKFLPTLKRLADDADPPSLNMPSGRSPDWSPRRRRGKPRL